MARKCDISQYNAVEAVIKQKTLAGMHLLIKTITLQLRISLAGQISHEPENETWGIASTQPQRRSND